MRSAIQHAQRETPITGHEAIALSSILQFAENLQLNLRAVLKEDEDWHRRLMPLTEVVKRAESILSQKPIQLLLVDVSMDLVGLFH